MIYEPQEDSKLFAEFLQGFFAKYGREISYCDMGTGSGILAEIARGFGIKNILAVDIDKEAVSHVSKQGIKALQSDLFSSVDGGFDVITFNAPYLPEDENDKSLATTGGKKGDEVSVRFLQEAKEHLNAGGKIFLLISSLTPREEIDKFNPKEIARKKLPFFEEIILLEFN